MRVGGRGGGGGLEEILNRDLPPRQK